MTTLERKRLAENPKYIKDDIIEITAHYKSGPGLKDLKPGKYRITNFRRSIMRVEHDMVYEFVSTRSNSSYKFVFSQNFIEINSKKV
jgi:hypothetical protein